MIQRKFFAKSLAVGIASLLGAVGMGVVMLLAGVSIRFGLLTLLLLGMGVSGVVLAIGEVCAGCDERLDELTARFSANDRAAVRAALDAQDAAALVSLAVNGGANTIAVTAHYCPTCRATAYLTPLFGSRKRCDLAGPDVAGLVTAWESQKA